MEHSQLFLCVSNVEVLDMKINASEYVGRGFPPEEGKKLADALLKRRDLSWEDLELDVSGLAPALLISAFFNGFLQHIYDRESGLLEKAKRVHWILQFPFQQANVDTWMSYFKPSRADRSHGPQ